MIFANFFTRYVDIAQSLYSSNFIKAPQNHIISITVDMAAGTNEVLGFLVDPIVTLLSLMEAGLHSRNSSTMVRLQSVMSSFPSLLVKSLRPELAHCEMILMNIKEHIVKIK